MTRKPKSVLITCPRVVDRTGLEVYVTDIARGLSARGWKVTVYAPEIGKHAISISSPLIEFIDDISAANEPDVIHGNFYFETIAACMRFPKTPLVFQTHSATIWQALPPKLPNLKKVLTVSAACSRVVETEVGLNASQIERTYNFVDTDTFAVRKDRLPDRPVRALVFSNQASEQNYLPLVRAACEAEGLSLDAVGLAVGAPAANPERLLSDYHLVFARGRAAIEAMAAGCAVVLCDHEGLGPLVSTANFDVLRGWNFGFQALDAKHSVDDVRSRILEYSSDDASAVSHLIRSGDSMSGALDVIEEHYRQVIDGRTSISFGYSDLVVDVDRRMAAEYDRQRIYDPFFRSHLLGLGLLKAEATRLGEAPPKRSLQKAWAGWLNGARKL